MTHQRALLIGALFGANLALLLIAVDAVTGGLMGVLVALALQGLFIAFAYGFARLLTWEKPDASR